MQPIAIFEMLDITSALRSSFFWCYAPQNKRPPKNTYKTDLEYELTPIVLFKEQPLSSPIIPLSIFEHVGNTLVIQ